MLVSGRSCVFTKLYLKRSFFAIKSTKQSTNCTICSDRCLKILTRHLEVSTYLRFDRLDMKWAVIKMDEFSGRLQYKLVLLVFDDIVMKIKIQTIPWPLLSVLRHSSHKVIL